MRVYKHTSIRSFDACCIPRTTNIRILMRNDPYLQYVLIGLMSVAQYRTYRALELQQQIFSLTAKLDSAQEETDSSEQRIHSLQEELLRVKEGAQQQQETMAQSLAEVQQLRSQITALQCELENMNVKNEQMERDMQVQREAAEEGKKEILAMKQKGHDLRKERDALLDREVALQDAISDARLERNKAKQSLSQVRSHLSVS